MRSRVWVCAISVVAMTLAFAAERAVAQDARTVLQAAAKALEMIDSGTATVRLELPSGQ